MGLLYVHVCGSTRVTNEAGDPVEKLGGVKPRQVLEMLALSVGRPMSKDRIAHLLWDGNPPPSYVGTLESYVCILRRALGAKGRDSALQTTTTGYLLRSDRVWVDVVAAKRMLASARQASAEDRIRLTDRALGLLDGGLLASEPHASWAESERVSHRREIEALLTETAEGALSLGDTGLALRLARTVTARTPLAERAAQIEMRALAAQGRHGEALGCYASLREAMVLELGTEPSHGSRLLYGDLLRDSSGIPRQATGLGGPDGLDDRHSRNELSSLMRLLRQALEAVPGVQVPERDADLAAMAVRVLSVA